MFQWLYFLFLPKGALRKGHYPAAGDKEIQAAVTEGLKHMPGRKGGSRYRVCEPLAYFVR